MYNLTAIEGNLNLDLSTFLNQIAETSLGVQAKQRERQRIINLFTELVDDYECKLQSKLTSINAIGSDFKLEKNYSLFTHEKSATLKFGHGRAFIVINFKINDNNDFEGNITYSGISTFKRNTAKLESVSQIIEFCEAPIKFLMLKYLVKDNETRWKIEETLMDYEG
jgi:hypothetical protein